MRSWIRWAVVVCSGAVVLAGCVPPPAPTPQLPATVGVRWVRDTGGGTIDPESGYYAAVFDRYQLLDGVVTGPTPAGEVPDPFPPQFNTSPFLPSQRPDGTARFPNNGFAGEGITMTGNDDAPYTMSFPAGSCTFGSPESTRSVYPSPDGTKAAVYFLSTEADANGMYIMSLVDGGTCPYVSGESYVVIGGGPGESVRPPVVWSPASDAVVYTVVHIDGSGSATTSTLHRLDATPEATFTTVGSPTAVGDQLIPLGWSVADRLLTWTTSDSVSTLATMRVTGGGDRVIERKDLRGLTPSGWAAHFGYFVPGTTTIVFNSLSKTVTNSTGQTLPLVRIRRIADAADAVSAPLTGKNPAVTWHQEALSGAGGPPFTLIDVPDAEVFERFVR